MKEKKKILEFPVKLNFFNYTLPFKETVVDAVLIKGKKKYFYLILSANDSLLDLFKISDEVYAFYDNSATFKFINKIEGEKCVFLKFEIVYNKFKSNSKMK